MTYTGASPRTVGDSLAANSSLQLNGNGSAPLVNVTGAGNFTLNGPNINSLAGTMGLILNASGDFNVVNPATTLTVTAGIGENNASRTLTVNASGGAGTVILGGTNTFTGGINIVGGTLQLNTALSTNGTVPNKISLSGGKLDLNNGPTIGGLSSAGGGVVEALGSNTLFISQDDAETYAGVLQDGAGKLTISKSGAGVLTLSGPGNTFTGQVSIVGGTILADHSSSARDSLATAPIPWCCKAAGSL